MEWYFIGPGILGLLVLFITIGMPIPFALTAAALPFIWTVQDLPSSLMSAEMMIWGIWFNYVMLAIPLFIFLGELVGHSQIGFRLYQVMHKGFPVAGAAAYGTVGACAGFGAICGSSVVGALTIGGVALPEMFRLGYNKRLAAGIVAAGGSLSVLIPPSVILLYYGVVTDVSVGKLFIGGFIPGLVLSGLFCLVIFAWRMLHPADVPAAERAGGLMIADLVIGLIPVLVIGTIVIAAIYFGVATPTEAAALADVVTFLLAVSIGGMRLPDFIEAIKGTLRTMGYLGVLLASSLLFGFVLNFNRVPQQFTALFLTLQLSPFEVLVVVIVFYVILGMFMEAASMTFITLPVLFPLVAAAGYDLIWFGIVYTVLIEVAVLTPPVGLNIYVLQGLAPRDLTFMDIVIGCVPFVGALLLMISLLIMFPDIALWLPGRMR